MKKMLIIGRGNEIGGATEYIITLIKLLHEKFEVDIHMTYGKEEVKNNYLNYFDYVTFHKINMTREINPLKDISTLKELRRLIRKEHFDIVHTNTSKGGILGRTAAKLEKVPFVFHTVHGFAFHEQSSNLKISIYSFIEKLAARFCDNLITVSDFHKEWALKLNIAPPEKIISIPNGLDLKRIETIACREDVRKEIGIGQDQLAVFTIARLTEQKGISHLLEAISLLKQENIDTKYHFYIAGTGDLENYLKQKCAELALKDQVTFLGYRSDVSNLLLAADVIAIPSLWEGLSISLLEAMASKNAIVCTDIGSNMTVVEANKEALIVPTKNSVKLKEALQLLLENELLRENLANASYEKFNSKFSVEIMLNLYADFYRNNAKLPLKTHLSETM